MPEPASGWPAWRAALLTVVIGVHLMIAAPLPHVVRPEELRTATAKEEVRRWTERLAAVGIPISEAELGERVVAISGAIGGAHNDAKRPFHPLLQLTGTGQGWALFANPNLRPDRFSVRIQRKGGFEDRYLQNDPELDWWRTTLRYRRVRGCWTGGMTRRPRKSQRRFTDWLARRIFEQEPDVRAVQTRLLRTRTPLPGRKVRDRVDEGHVITVRRPSAGKAP